jgi:hypothetical protein
MEYEWLFPFVMIDPGLLPINWQQPRKCNQQPRRSHPAGAEYAVAKQPLIYAKASWSKAIRIILGNEGSHL